MSSAPQEDRGGEGDSLYSSSSFKSSCNSLTWDTLKKIRRQKSRRHTNELKKYQSTVCIYGEDKFTSLQDEAPPRGLKYEDVYRSSPSLCEDRGLAATRHLSASRLKFTGEEPQEQSHYPGATAKFLFLNVWSDVYFSHDIFKFQIGVSKVPWLRLILKMSGVRLVIQIMRTQLRSMTRLELMTTAIAGSIVCMSASSLRRMKTAKNWRRQVRIFTELIIFLLLAAGLYQDNKVIFLLEHTLSLSPFILPPSELVNIWSCEHTAAP